MINNPQNLKIAVIIPMFRVEKYIEIVLLGIPKWIDFIICVDDCSPDDSAQKVRGVNDPRITLIRTEENSGVGRAVLHGFQKGIELDADILIKMDGDNQMDPAQLPRLVQPLIDHRSDYAKGNRFFHITHIKKMPLNRRIGNLGLSFLTKAASGYWNVFDPTNGFLAITSDWFKLLDIEKIHSRYFFEISMLVELHINHARVLDVPMPARYLDEISSLNVGKSLVEFPLLLIKNGIRRIWLEYFVLDFNMCSFFFVIGMILSVFGVIWGAVAWKNSIISGVPATTGTVIISLLPIMLGFSINTSSNSHRYSKSPRN